MNPDNHDDSLGGTATTDRDDPHTLLPILATAAKVVYVIVSILAIGFILPLLVSSL